MCKKPGYFKNFFANFLAQYDDESYQINKDKKSQLFEGLKGQVLEIGPGTGVNFRFLQGMNIEWTGLEPNHAMHPFLMETARKFGIRANLLTDPAENPNLSYGTFDFVISTEVLCSVDDLPKTLIQILNLLRPGGKFLFLEHVVDKDNFIRRAVQKTLPFTPWRYYSDGCRPGRDIARSIRDADFSKVDLTEYMQEGDGIIHMINRPHIIGWAQK